MNYLLASLECASAALCIVRATRAPDNCLRVVRFGTAALFAINAVLTITHPGGTP